MPEARFSTCFQRNLQGNAILKSGKLFPKIKKCIFAKTFLEVHIAVNTRLLISGKLEGIGWFTFETLRRICKRHPEHQFTFIFDRPYNPKFIFEDNISAIVLPPAARHPLLFYTWFEWRIPPLLRQIKADLFVSPDGYLSLHSEIKQLAVIHDINFEHYPQHLPLAARKYLKYYFPKFAKKATRIATVSEFSKTDIVKQYKVKPEKIDVVYNGFSECFKPISIEKANSIRKQLTSGSPYFIYVGALQPRKNIANLLLAFDAFREKHNNEFKLVLTGEKKWWSNKTEAIFTKMKYSHDVIFTGRMEQEKLAENLAAAHALCYVSFFEGFGIPLLEAMASDVPVITAASSSLPEVAEEAALFVSPFDFNSISEAMLQLANNEETRNKLIEKGRVQIQKFSWEHTASKLWDSIEKTLEC